MSTQNPAALLLRSSPLLKPLVTLAGWTFVMEAWMYATRIPALSKYKLNTSSDKIKSEMETKIPIQIRQVADNYNHLHEQPTVFYAVTLALALLGDENKWVVGGAWGYVGVRIAHSLFQSLVNQVMVSTQRRGEEVEERLVETIC